MIPLGMWFTRGPLGTPSAAVPGAQWVWPLDAIGIRAFEMRIRTGQIGEFGHTETPTDPGTDTREDWT
jgi:hypothetical protein